MSEKLNKPGGDKVKTEMGPISCREFTIASVAVLGTASGSNAKGGRHGNLLKWNGNHLKYTLNMDLYRPF